MAVDPGARRMGVALATPEVSLVAPLAVVPYEGCVKAAETISQLADEHDVWLVVIGLPGTKDGDETPACRRSRVLAQQLTESSRLEVRMHSELLTTREARRRARELGRPPRQPVDDLAAQVLLEDFLSTDFGAARNP